MPSYNMYKGHMDKDSRAGGLNVGKGVGWSGGSNGGENRNNCKLITIKNRKKKEIPAYIIRKAGIFYEVSFPGMGKKSVCFHISNIQSYFSTLHTVNCKITNQFKFSQRCKVNNT